MVIHALIGSLTWLSIRLKDLKREVVEQNNQFIAQSMEKVVNGAAEDIKECWNACDTYLKKRAVTRWIKSALWDVTFGDFLGRFKKRKNQFVFALSVHQGHEMKDANEKLDTLQETTKEIQEQYVLFFLKI